MKTLIWKDTGALMFIAALFTIASFMEATKVYANKPLV